MNEPNADAFTRAREKMRCSWCETAFTIVVGFLNNLRMGLRVALRVEPSQTLFKASRNRPSDLGCPLCSSERFKMCWTAPALNTVTSSRDTAQQPYTIVPNTIITSPLQLENLQFWPLECHNKLRRQYPDVMVRIL